MDGDGPRRRHAVGDEHLPDRLRGADEAVDLAVLPARQRVVPAGGSRRGATATSGGLASCVLIESASAAIATPCGSCAWTMSGLSCLMSRDSRQAALRSISVFGASGMRSRPSLRALPQLAGRMRDEHRPMAERPQAEHRDQHLVLPAAPRPRRVDVEGEHHCGRSAVAEEASGGRWPSAVPATAAAERLGLDVGCPRNLGDGGRCSRRALRRDQACGSRAAAPRAYELQEYVVRVQDRDEESRRAVAEAAAEDVVPQKRHGGWMATSSAIRPAALGEPLLGRERRVAIDRREVIRDVAVRVVLQVVLERVRAALFSSTDSCTRRPFHAPARGRRAAAGSRGTSRCRESSVRDNR